MVLTFLSVQSPYLRPLQMISVIMHDVLLGHPAVRLAPVGNVPGNVPVWGTNFNTFWGTIFQYIWGIENQYTGLRSKNDLPLGLCPRGMENCTPYSLG